MFARLARFVSRHWLAVLLTWAVVPLAVHCFAPRWDDVTRDGDFAYLPDRMTSARGEKLVALSFPNQTSKSQVVLVVSRPKTRLQPADMDVASRLAETFAPHEGQNTPVASVWTHDEPVVGQKLLSPYSPAGQAVLVILQLRTEFMALENMAFITQLYKTLDSMRAEADFPPGLELGVTGSAAIGGDMLVSAEESIRNTEIATVILVVIILLAVYRAPGLVIVPLLSIGVSLMFSTDLVAALARCSDLTSWYEYRVFRTTKIFIVVLLFGAATDYCLFLISRYREELQRGLSPREAVEEALGKTGHALAGSAMTTILGLGAMIFADFGKFRYGGPTMAISLLVALAACITLAPALLRAAGLLVFWPFGIGAATNTTKVATGTPAASFWRNPMGRFWERLAGLIVRHPGLIFVGCIALLAVPAWSGLDAPITYNLLGELASDRPSVVGTKLLQKHLPVGETGPISILAYDPSNSFDSDAGRRKISMLTKELYDFQFTDKQGKTVKPVLSVRSLTNPLGEPPGSFSPFTPAGRRKMAALKNPRTRATFLSDAPGYTGQVTRFDLVCQYDPFSTDSRDLLSSIERRVMEQSNQAGSPWQDVSFDFIGITAGIRDLEAVNSSDYFRIGVMVSLAVLAVLVFLLHRPLISIYLVMTVLLGYFVTMGVTEVLFSWLHGDSFQGLDWKLPLFLFVILVAVGEDYNIYLATRVFEEQRKLGLLEGLRVALIQTGGIITSCGVIMAGTFASMLTGTLRGMHEMGFALAFGVLLDTFIIRTIMVPAFLALWARFFPGKSGEARPSDSEPDAIAIPMHAVAESESVCCPHAPISVKMSRQRTR